MPRVYRVLFSNCSLTSCLPLIAALRSQKELNIEIICNTPDKFIPAIYFADHSNLVPAVNSKKYFSTLLNVCRKEKIDFLWVLSDKEAQVINSQLSEFAKLKCRIIIPSKQTLAICLDKAKQATWFVKHHFTTPQRITALSQIKAKKLYVVKPLNSSGSRNVQVLKGEALKKIPQDQLVQEYLFGQEYTVDCLVGKEGKLIAHVIRERLQILGGQSIAGRTVKNRALSIIINQLIAKLPFFGLINIQFIKTKRQLYLLEINSRPAMGGLALSIKAGVNFPLLLLKNCLNLPTKPAESSYQKEIYMLRYISELFLHKEKGEFKKIS